MYSRTKNKVFVQCTGTHHITNSMWDNDNMLRFITGYLNRYPNGITHFILGENISSEVILSEVIFREVISSDVISNEAIFSVYISGKVIQGK